MVDTGDYNSMLSSNLELVSNLKQLEHELKIKQTELLSQEKVIQSLTSEIKSKENFLQNKYDELIDKLPVGFAHHSIICDDNGIPVNYRYIRINKKFEEFTGIKAEDVIGKTILDVLPDIDKHWIDLFGKVALTGISTEYENIAQPLGKYYFVHAYAPKIGEFIVLFFDITNQKLIEKELIEKRKQLELAMKIGRIGYWHWEIGSEQDYWDANLNLLFGLPERSSVQSIEYSLMHPNDREVVNQYMTSKIKKCEPFETEFRIIRPDKEIIWIHMRAELDYDDKGKPLAYSGACIDITNLKTIESALQENEVRLRTIFENSPIAIGIIKNGKNNYVNPQYYSLLGYTDESEVINQPFYICIAPDYRDEIIKRNQRRQQGQKEISIYETRGVKKDGTEFPMQAYIATFSENNEFATVFFIYDISEQKRHEEQLKFQAEEITAQYEELQATTEELEASSQELEQNHKSLLMINKKLKESEEQYRSLVEKLPIGVYRTTADGKLLFANPALHKILELDSALDITNINIKDFFIDPSFRTENLSVWIQSKALSVSEYQLRTRLGKVIWIRDTGKAVFDDDGSFLYLDGIVEDFTERKEAEDSLAKAILLLEHTFEQSSAPMVLISMPDGIIRLYNSACIEHLGEMDRDSGTKSFIGTSLLDYKRSYIDYDPQGNVIPFNELPLVHALSGKKTINKLGKLIRKDGSIRWHLINSTPIYNEKNEIIAAYLMINDITERKQAEDELRASETLLTEMTSQVPGVLYQFYARSTGEFGFYYVNNSSEQILGLKPDLDGYFERFSKLVLPEFRDSFAKSIEKVVTEFTDWYYEGMLQKPSGEIIWFSGNAKPSRRENEIVFNGLVQDISERKNAEASIRESEQRFRALFENSGDAIMLFDKVFVECNQASLKLLKCKRDDFINHHPSDFSPEFQPNGKSSKELSEHYINAALKGVPQTFYWQHLAKDETLIDAEIRLSPIQHREKIMLLASIRDITIRKQDEDNRLLVAKLQSLGTLAGGLAHDFNNLLTAIFGNIQMASLENSVEDIKQRLAANDPIFERAVGLTRQLLTFSKGGEPNRVVTPIDKIIENNVKFFLSGSKVGLTLNLEHDLWQGYIDPDQIGQVLQNLITNAREAMNDNGHISIYAGNMIENNQKYVLIKISDTGPGIEPDKKLRIFDPYFTSKSTGSGLGLSICRSIINKHGGNILVESKFGYGATFTVTLPATDERFETQIIDSSMKSSSISRSIKILVLDDEHVILSLISRLLEKQGHQVVCSKDGKETIQLFKKAKDNEKPFDIVILDLTIPGGMGGRETIKELLRIDPKIRAIVSSGYSDDPVVSNYKSYGFIAALSKPYKLRELNEVLFNLLNSIDETKN